MNKKRSILDGFSNKLGVARILRLSVAFVIILVAFVVVFMSNRAYVKMVNQQSQDRLIGVAKIAEGIFKSVKVERYFHGEPVDDEFVRMMDRLKQITEATGMLRIGLVYKGSAGNTLYSLSTQFADDVPFKEIPMSWNEFFEDYEPKDDEITIQVDPVNDVVSVARAYYDETEGDYCGLVGVAMSQESYTAQILTYRNTTVAVVAMNVIVIIIAFSIFLSKYMINPIKEITRETLRFANEKDYKPRKLKAARKHDEIGVLAKAVISMESDIDKYIESLTKAHEEKSRVLAELNIAAAIQQGMMPEEAFPDHKDFEIAASMTPAREVGGDFYDYYFIDKKHLAIVIADVSGKGIPAALFMMVSQMLIKQILIDNPKKKPSEVLSGLDQIFNQRNSTEQFVTVWLGILNLGTGEVVATNAGHEFPVISQGENGQYIAMKDKHNPPVATVEGLERTDYKFKLRKGDSLLVYTDGVLEATDSNNKLYGMERLLDVLNKKKESTAAGTIKCVIDSVNSFVGKAEQFDDMTLLNIIYKG